MEMNFCRRCGTEMSEKSKGAYVCINGHRIYDSAAPAANIFFVTDDNDVILSVRGIEPFKGMLDTIGGFIEATESAEQAIVREIKEETGLTKEHYSRPEFLCSTHYVYPYDGEDRDTLPLFFWARINDDANPRAADDISSIVRVPLFETPQDDLDNMKVREQFLLLRSVITEKDSL